MTLLPLGFEMATPLPLWHFASQIQHHAFPQYYVVATTNQLQTSCKTELCDKGLETGLQGCCAIFVFSAPTCFSARDGTRPSRAARRDKECRREPHSAESTMHVLLAVEEISDEQPLGFGRSTGRYVDYEVLQQLDERSFIDVCRS